MIGCDENSARFCTLNEQGRPIAGRPCCWNENHDVSQCALFSINGRRDDAPLARDAIRGHSTRAHAIHDARANHGRANRLAPNLGRRKFLVVERSNKAAARRSQAVAHSRAQARRHRCQRTHGPPLLRRSTGRQLRRWRLID